MIWNVYGETEQPYQLKSLINKIYAYYMIFSWRNNENKLMNLRYDIHQLILCKKLTLEHTEESDYFAKDGDIVNNDRLHGIILRL